MAAEAASPRTNGDCASTGWRVRRCRARCASRRRCMPWRGSWRARAARPRAGRWRPEGPGPCRGLSHWRGKLTTMATGHLHTGWTFVHGHQTVGCPGADAVSRARYRACVRGTHRVGRLGSPGHGSRAPAAHREPPVRRLGALAGTAAAAERAAHDIEARLAALKRTYGTGGAGRAPAVLLQVWNRPIYTVGGRHLMSDALEICGARNVFADLPEAGPL